MELILINNSIKVQDASREIQSDMAHLLRPSERHDEGDDEW